MLGRILRAADFERVLNRPVCARSAHFAVHYLAGTPHMPGRRPEAASDPDSHKLSTADAPTSAQPVDEREGIWLGTVVPKRHAKRAVTRNLLRRQIRAALLRRQAAGAATVRAGLWIVRLRTGFDRAVFVSAASPALRHAAREELDAVLADAARKLDAGPAAHQVPR